MGHGPAAPERIRLHVVDEGTTSDLRVTSHVDAGVFVVSLWRGNVCTGTIRLEPDEAARLVAHFAEGLASIAEAPTGTAEAATETRRRPRWRGLIERLPTPIRRG